MLIEKAVKFTIPKEVNISHFLLRTKAELTA